MHRFAAFGSADHQNARQEKTRNSPKLPKISEFSDSLVNHGKYPRMTCMPYFHLFGRQLCETGPNLQRSDNLDAYASLRSIEVPGLSKRMAGELEQITAIAYNGPISR